ncbi:MAG: hypothetical protein LH480_06520 [Rubrivivax sp.]|nr:hypothetical protein [Rubrivivax sp.]
MSVRWFTFVVWAAVAATALFWALKLTVRSAPTPSQLQVADGSAAVRGDLTRLLGVDALAPQPDAAPTAAAEARFSLLGVVSPRSPQAAREGVALIAVDGKPAKAFRIGAVVDGQTVLQSVEPRGASLGLPDGPSQMALRIAPPTAAAVGTLPSAMQPGMPQTSGAPPPQRRGLPPQMMQPSGSATMNQLPQQPTVREGNLLR